MKIVSRLLSAGLLLLASLASGVEPAARPEKDSAAAESPMIESVDIPTAEILNAGTFATTFRFYNEGGITSRLIFAPLRRVNLGIYFDTQRVIGSNDPHLIRPSVFFKLRFYDGSDALPALALGYDNQGFLYQEDTKEFLNREKGLYLAGSHEIFIPDLEFHAGVNMFDFDNNAAVFGFIGATYKITPSFALLSDYDNIRNLGDDRFNLGGRFYVTPGFNVDFAARNIGRGTSRGAERILRLNYVGRFSV